MPVVHNYLISHYTQNLNFNPFKAHIYDFTKAYSIFLLF